MSHTFLPPLSLPLSLSLSPLWSTFPLSLSWLDGLLAPPLGSLLALDGPLGRLLEGGSFRRGAGRPRMLGEGLEHQQHVTALPSVCLQYASLTGYSMHFRLLVFHRSGWRPHVRVTGRFLMPGYVWRVVIPCYEWRGLVSLKAGQSVADVLDTLKLLCQGLPHLHNTKCITYSHFFRQPIWKSWNWHLLKKNDNVRQPAATSVCEFGLWQWSETSVFVAALTGSRPARSRSSPAVRTPRAIFCVFTDLSYTGTHLGGSVTEKRKN